MNMAPRAGLGAVQPTVSQAHSVIFKTLNQLGNTQPTIYPNTSSFPYPTVPAEAALGITLPSLLQQNSHRHDSQSSVATHSPCDQIQKNDLRGVWGTTGSKEFAKL
jgi:hypothetical protein